MRTISGPGGNPLQVPVTVNGLVPANGAVLDLLIDLVDPARVAALPADSLKYANVPDDQRAAWEARPVLADLHLEELISAGVDFVIAHDWQQAKLDEVFKGTSIACLYLPTVTAFEDITASVRWASLALETESRGDELIQRLQAIRTQLADRAGPVEALSALVYSNYGAGGGTSGSGTSYDLMIRMAGLKNAATEAGIHGHADLDIEGLLAIQPDFLIVSGEGPGTSASLDSLKDALQGAPLNAIQNDRVLYLAPNQLTTTSHHIVFAARSLQEQALALETEAR